MGYVAEMMLTPEVKANLSKTQEGRELLAEMEQSRKEAMREAKREALRMTAFPFKGPKQIMGGNFLSKRFRV